MSYLKNKLKDQVISRNIWVIQEVLLKMKLLEKLSLTINILKIQVCRNFSTINHLERPQIDQVQDKAQIKTPRY